MASYQIPAVQPLNFGKPEEWPRWIKRFERFRQASELATKSEERQVNTLVYSMGDKAEDILRSFNLTADDAKSYATVKEKFEAHFVKDGTQSSSVRNSISADKKKQKRLTTSSQMCTLWRNTADTAICMMKWCVIAS